MFEKFSLKKKLLLLCFLMAFVICTISFFGYLGLQSVQDSNDRVVDGVVPNLALINKMAISYRDVRIHLRTLGLSGLNKNDAENAIKGVLESIDKYEADLKASELLVLSPGEKELNEELKGKWRSFKSIGEKALGYYKSGKPEDHEAMMKIFFVDCPESAADYSKTLDKLLEFHRNNLAKFTAESKSIATKTNSLITVISLAGIVASITLGLIFAISLSRTLKEVVQSLKESADEVSSAANHIASTSEQLSQASTEQASSLQETSSSVEEISSMISSNTESAKQSARSSEASLANAEKGKEVVEQMITAIDQINNSNNKIMEQINESNKEIEEIVKLIGDIGNKTKVINDIVFQTKLLSFNASVEAARAGENGKGFAVVAEEVGNLAAMSGSAAVEISSMLNNSIQKVEGIVKNSKEKVGALIAEGKTNVEKGTRIATECGNVLNEIVGSVANVSSAVTQIATASQEQAQGVSEITKAISQLDVVTQENTASSAESANAAATLSQQAAKLTQLVGSLVVTVEGRNDDRPHSTLATQEVRTKQRSKAPQSARVLSMNRKEKPKRMKDNRELPLAQDARFSDI